MKQKSSIIMLSLAELAWLGVFAVLILTQAREQEVATLKSKFSQYNYYAEHEQQLGILFDNFSESNTSNFKDYINSVIWSKDLLSKSESELSLAKKEINKITESAQKLNTALDEAKSKVEMLEEKLDESETQKNEYNKTIVQASSLITQLQNDKNDLIKQKKDKIKEEILIRKELLGLPDRDLEKVVFLIDNSSSIRNSDAWNESKRLINIWLEHLRVARVSIILYSDEVLKFPDSGFADVIDSDGKKDLNTQEEILSFFNNSTSGVYSDMTAGLNTAYSLGSLDLIILISDGKPKTKSKSTKASEREVIELINKNRYTPILSIAVSDYYVVNARSPREDPNPAISFLKLVSSTSGGNFVGK